ncbi:hypothetical protein FA13DRAFT_1690318 [Coprinellus micaceus]|uniref:Protein kinase domain-containing protein n=1 Tax=Coprinellus micaceus TaxID=71717 RepID=A0A4Y7T4D5_COPMI|nr:hypothetical protein FA13DRAFT_1690318 [Coprinellus micaceus]
MASNNTEDQPPEQHIGIDVLTSGEEAWKELYTFFLDAGYRLRSRYEPGWKPSWLEVSAKSKYPEDAVKPFTPNITHATHLKTGQYVVIKRIESDEDSTELDVMAFLTAEERAGDPRNHCVRALGILDHPSDPQVQFVILPLLRKFDDPPFETIGEVVDFVGQVLEGIEFLHDNGVAHLDISINNVMLDGTGMYPTGFHPVDQSRNFEYTGPAVRQFTRTEKPPTYIFIDFGISERFDADERRITWNKEGTDHSVPEYQEGYEAPVDPFEVDVYCLGNLVKTDIIQGNPKSSRSGYYGFEFLEPLVDKMTQQVPKDRPSMKEAMELFHSLVEKVEHSHLRSRCRRRPLFKGDRELPPVEVYNTVRHAYKKLVYTYKGLPAIPKRSPPKDKEPAVVQHPKSRLASLFPGRILGSTSKSEPAAPAEPEGSARGEEEEEDGTGTGTGTGVGTEVAK